MEEEEKMIKVLVDKKQSPTLLYIIIHYTTFRFTDDKATWSIYEQFLWGPALLISPALHEVS